MMQGGLRWHGLHGGKLMGQDPNVHDDGGYPGGLAGAASAAGDYSSYPGAVNASGLVSEHALLNSMGLAGGNPG